MALGGTTAQSLAYQDIGSIVPGQMYQVSVWVQSSSSSTNGVQLYLHDTLGNGSVVTTVSPTTSWQQISTAFTGAASGKLRIHLVQLPGTAETTYWDDVTVTVLPSNGGFETGALVPWTIEGGSAGVGPGAQHSGVYGAAESGSAQTMLYQDVAGLIPGQLYEVSTWAASSTTTTNGAELWLHDTQQNGVVGNVFSPSPTYQQVSAIFTATSLGKLRIHLIQLSGGAETTYWDDVTVTPLPPDGDFEMGILGPWLIGGGTAVTGSSAAHSGAYGLALSGTSQDFVYQDVAGLIPGQTYQVSVWVAGTASISNGAELWMHDTQGNGVSGIVASPNPSWQQTTAPFTATATGKLRIHLIQFAGSSAATYWDDVTITPLSNGQSPNAMQTTPVKMVASSPVTINGHTYSSANARKAAGKSSDPVVPASKTSPVTTPGAKAAGTSALPAIPVSQMPPPAPAPSTPPN